MRAARGGDKETPAPISCVMTLRIHEELLLLALHDKKGTNAFAPLLDPALGGGLMAELLLDDRIELRKEGRRGLITVIDPSRTSDPVLDMGLKKLDSARRRADPQTTVLRLARIKDLKAEIARGLCRRGILRAREDEVLILFRRKVYPTVDPGPERALIERIRRVLDDDEAPDARTAIMIGLAQTSGALGAVYDRKERRALKKKIAGLQEATLAGGATKEAVDAIQTAIFVSTVIS